MHFIRVNTVDGSEATLNAAKIVSVTPTDAKGSLIVMDNGFEFTATQSNRVVRGLLGGGSEA